jgi:signal peptidase II
VLALAGGTALAVVAVDLGTKVLVRDGLDPGAEHQLAGELLRLVHVENSGVAFGQLSGSPLLVAAFVAAAVVALLAYFFTHLDTDAVWLPTGLLIGGALGNALDRAVGGNVTDFVKLPHWPAFNVADIAITLGVLILLVVVERDARARERQAGTDGPDDHS